ncbi:hypothetical protein QNN03_38775, partial [Streptomyces sp. GXMU-J15]
LRRGHRRPAVGPNLRRGHRRPAVGPNLRRGHRRPAVGPIAECEAALSTYVDWSLTEVLRGDDDAWMQRVDVVQPVLWAVMV